MTQNKFEEIEQEIENKNDLLEEDITNLIGEISNVKMKKLRIIYQYLPEFINKQMFLDFLETFGLDFVLPLFIRANKRYKIVSEIWSFQNDIGDLLHQLDNEE